MGAQYPRDITYLSEPQLEDLASRVASKLHGHMTSGNSVTGLANAEGGEMAMLTGDPNAVAEGIQRSAEPEPDDASKQGSG